MRPLVPAMLLAALQPAASKSPELAWSEYSVVSIVPGSLPVLAGVTVHDCHDGTVLLEWSVPEASAAAVGGFVITREQLLAVKAGVEVWGRPYPIRVLEPGLRLASDTPGDALVGVAGSFRYRIRAVHPAR